MQPLNPVSLPIQAQLNRVEEIIKEVTTTSVPIITQVVHYVIENGGKRLRPTLTLLAAGISGYTGESAARMGAAMEMVHTTSLMHDDVIDNAMIRRGKASANARWGNQISVLVGDFFWCKASELMVKENSFRILKVIIDTITSTTEGEVIEVTKSNDIRTSEDEYLDIIRLKTAILLGSCAQIGAILGNVSEQYERALQQYGFDLGMAFQLADDVLDYTSEESRFGKSRGTDLREGKLTLPLITALKCCTHDERAIIKDTLLAKSISELQLQAVSAIIKRYGGLDYTLKLARSYVEKAKSHLDSFKHSIEKEAMLALADYVIDRDM